MIGLNILKRGYSKRQNVTNSKYTVEIEIEYPEPTGIQKIFNVNTRRGRMFIMSANVTIAFLVGYLLYSSKKARLKKPVTDAEEINDVQ